MIGISLGLTNIVPAGGFLPSGLSGIWLWLKGDAGVTLVSSRVSTWADQSGNGRNFSQGIAGNRPTVGAVNSLSTVHVDATVAEQYLDMALASGPSAGHIFAVIKGDSSFVGSRQHWVMGSAVDGDWYTFSGSIYDDFGSTTRKTVGVAPSSLNVANIYEITSTAGAWEAKLNGASMFSTGTNTVGWASTLRLGAGISASGAPFYGDFAEIVIYDNVKGSSDAAKVRSYLQTKWATP